VRRDTLEVVVVRVAMLLEEEAQIQQRLREHRVGAEQQRDHEPADAAVAVEKRTDLELDVRERSLDEDRRRAVEHLAATRHRSHADPTKAPFTGPLTKPSAQLESATPSLPSRLFSLFAGTKQVTRTALLQDF